VNTILNFDVERTKLRIHDLEQYYNDEVFGGQRLICESFISCKSSIPKSLDYYSGQLSHVGNKYDLCKDGRDLRLVVTGISYGHAPAMVDMKHRRKMVENAGIERSFYKTETKRGRNPHMKGTTLLLKRILLGEGSLKNYADWREEFIGEIGHPENHIFNMFALVNLLLCSARAGTARDRSSHIMKRHCFGHYIETLKILQPNLVIFQAQGIFELLLNETGLSSCWHRQNANLGYFTGHGLNFVSCEFYHPSHPLHLWGCKPVQYFERTVLSTLCMALQNIGFE
jgi:hypothetical protein